MRPEIIHIRPEQYVVSQWSGGTTTQLAIAPEGAAYADRDFLWRLSSAAVELDQSDFTPLPDYTRLISVLRGGMRLSHGGGEVLELAPYTVHAFDGGEDTHSWGRCTDFNLMLRKGRCQGSLQSLCSEAAGQADITIPVLSPGDYASATLAVYCGGGALEVSLTGQSVRLAAGETALIHHAGVCPVHLDWDEGVRLMLAHIYS